MEMQINREQFWAGYEAGWERAEVAEKGKIGDPVGVHGDYQMGWWNGVGECQAWDEGYRAVGLGLLFCPYLADADDECFRASWLGGYQAGWELMTGLQDASRAVN